MDLFSLIIRVVLAIVALLVLRFAARAFLKDVGKKALAKQPDAIHVTRKAVIIWRDTAAVRKLADGLAACGFEEIGDYTVTEWPQVQIKFLMKPADGVYACVYEHEKAGVWMDVITRYKEGMGATFTTARDRGMDHRPGEIVVHAPGTSPEALYKRLMDERPKGNLEPISAEGAVRLFEQVSNEQLAWRKKRGISAEEVARVAKTRVKSA